MVEKRDSGQIGRTVDCAYKELCSALRTSMKMCFSTALNYPPNHQDMYLVPAA